MTDVQSARSALSRNRRLMAGLTTAGIVGALVTPALGVTPAAAAPAPCSQSAQYGAKASADLIKLGLLDLNPLGIKLGPVADVRVSSAGSGLTGPGTVHSEASAQLIAANLLGLNLPLGQLSQPVYQQAPPANAKGETRAVANLRIPGALTAGVGQLNAYATWVDGMECGQASGQATKSSSSIADVAILPASSKKALVKLPGELTSSTTTGLTNDNDVVRSVASASVGLAEVKLFAGSQKSEISVKVIKPPTLQVSTAGSKATAKVEYTSPILEISGPSIGTKRLDAPGETIDIALPTKADKADEAGNLARSQGLPLLGDDLLGGVLGGLTGGTEEVQPKDGKDAPLAPHKLDIPKIAKGESAGNEIGDQAEAKKARVKDGLSLLRLSVGDLEKQITDQTVEAKAASLRLQVVSAKGEQATSVVDLGIGLLEAAATAPLDEKGAGGGGSSGSGSGGGLPLTGANVGLFAGAGAALLAAGGALIVFTRRRRLS